MSSLLHHVREALAQISQTDYSNKRRIFPWQPGPRTPQLAEIAISLFNQVSLIDPKNEDKLTIKEVSLFFLKLWNLLLSSGEASVRLEEKGFDRIPKAPYAFWKLEEVREEYHSHFFQYFLSLFEEAVRILVSGHFLYPDQVSHVFNYEQAAAELAFAESGIAERFVSILETQTTVEHDGWLVRKYEREGVEKQRRIFLFQKLTKTGEVREVKIRFEQRKVGPEGEEMWKCCVFECAKVGVAYDGITQSSEHYCITASGMTLVDLLQFIDWLKSLP